VHHRTIQINHKPDATIFQFIILTFIYSSKCFGRFPAHYQELNDCSGSLWFYLGKLLLLVGDLFELRLLISSEKQASTEEWDSVPNSQRGRTEAA
jgi:hypothetical protein